MTNDRALLAAAARLEVVLARWPGLPWALACELAKPYKSERFRNEQLS